jgi:hypothetical protein
VRGRYTGEVDPATKLRSGQGIYQYPNGYFQYQGEWKDGKKNGFGALVMRDGSFYKGDWVMGEQTGQGKRVWEDGSSYIGKFDEGEKNGYGEMTYGTLNSAKE